MPFSLKRPSSANPKVKEWKSITHENGYVEIIKYKTRARAEQEASSWGGAPTIVEVNWGAGETSETYPDY